MPGGQGSSPARIRVDARGTARSHDVGAGAPERSDRARDEAAGAHAGDRGTRGAVMVARPLGEVDSELSRLLLILGDRGRGGIALAAGLGRAGGAGGAGAGAAVHGAYGDADRGGRAAGGRASTCPDGWRWRAATSWGGWRTASTGRSTRWSVRCRSQRRLVADAGHELRTPIASLRANIQVLGEAERLPAAEQESLRRGHRRRAGRADRAGRRTSSSSRGARHRRAGRRTRCAWTRSCAVAIERARAARRGAVRGAAGADGRDAGRRSGSTGPCRNLLENARKWSPDGRCR